MKKELELKLLEMCEEILPNTRMANNKKLKDLLEEIRNSLKGDK
jgi:Zn-dependent M16 (insulinase) family peptidase